MGAVVGLSFCAGLAQDLHGRVEEQAGHLNRDDKVGPTGVEPIDRHSGPHDRDIADGVVAAAQPDGAHIGIAASPKSSTEETLAASARKPTMNSAHEFGARQFRRNGASDR